jgi:hypothetical protein
MDESPYEAPQQTQVKYPLRRDKVRTRLLLLVWFAAVCYVAVPLVNPFVEVIRRLWLR